MKKQKRPNPELIDDDNPEWTAEDFAKARPVAEVFKEIFPPEVAAELLAPRGRGPGKRPRKVLTALRLDPGTLARWKASGRGWQTRMAEVLAAKAPKKAA